MILKPWEIAPLGSIVKAFVHEVDGRRKRIGLTTYAPEQWNDMLPMKVTSHNYFTVLLLSVYINSFGKQWASYTDMILIFSVRNK